MIVSGEKGYALSGGERQRVGIARALCKNSSILLMDEATSALDVATETTIVERMHEFLPTNVTLIVAAHRLSTLKRADRILVLDKGRVESEQYYEQLVNGTNN